MKARVALLAMAVVLAIGPRAGSAHPTSSAARETAALMGEPAAGQLGPLAAVGGSAQDEPEKKKPRKKRSGEKEPNRDKKADMSDVRPDKKGEKAALEALGEGFSVKRTGHYSIVYNTSEQDVKTFGVAIEKTFRSCINYAHRLGIEIRPPKKKLLIYYFEEHPDYSAYSGKLGKGELSQSTPGVYFPDLNISLFFNYQNQESFKNAREQAEAQIEQLRQQLRGSTLSSDQRRQIRRQIAEARRQANRSSVVGGDMSESIVQHEVAHQVMWNVGFHHSGSFLANPRWFAEGTAMMFEPISDGRSANFGAINEMRLREFRHLESEGKLIPVRDLVSDLQFFGPQTVEIAYPESWALVHYLNRAKRKQVKKYVDLINKRPDDYVPDPEREIATFEKAFGKLDEKWVRRWKNWIADVR